ncbi:MAG: S8 family serine peptidase [Thermoanaerobaculales bacterium]|nr:S8 family serine peptidase [Thermoanaerobaculales bacterium]
MLTRSFIVITSLFLMLTGPGSALAAGERALGAEMTAKVQNQGLLLLRSAHFDPTDRTPTDVGLGLSDWRDQSDGRVLGVVQFSSTPTAKSRTVLERAGVEHLFYIPNNAYLIRFDLADLETVLGFAGVRAVFRLPKWARVEPGLLDSPVDGDGRVAVEIMAAPGVDAHAIAAALGKRIEETLFVTNSDHHERGRVIARIRSGELYRAVDLLTGLEDVLSVDLWREKQLLNDHSIWVGQSYDTVDTTNYAITAPIWNQGILGAGQIVCVNDSGLDSDMCYFRFDGSAGSKTTAQSPLPPDIGTVEPGKKVVAYYVEPGADAYDTSAASYHGTHVSGSVAGDNHLNLSTGLDNGHDNGDGMAPQAQIVLQDVGNSGGGLAGLAGDLTDMFRQAYDAGARIHSDSWGTTASVYDGTALDMDEFMFRNQDFLFVVAMGNSGTAPGDGSIGSPATAKNIVSVGATTNGGAGSQADNLMTYSRGPVDDGRMKPDIVSPGVSVNSASGTTSNTDDNCSAKDLSGTSMATPTTSGYLALLRQYYTDGFYPSGGAVANDARIPSGALMKATLIVGGMPLGGIDIVTSSAVTTIPSLDQGWGRTHLDNSLFFSGDSRQLRVWDVRHDAGIATGEQVEYTLQVPTGAEPLDVRLVWSDPESSTLAAVNLVNNLDLEVVSPSSVLYLGNVFSSGSSATGGSADVLNPVEGVVIPSPVAGAWTLRIKGTAVPGTGTAPYSDRQGYALVATFGSCGSTVAAPTGLTASDNPPTGITLSWSHAGASGFLIYRAPGATPAPGDFSLVGTSSIASFTDVYVQGGYTYSYVIRATDGCAESGASAKDSVTFTGACTLFPTFDGVIAVTNDLESLLCDLVVDWSLGQSNCPFEPTVTYNVFRDITPYFTPGAGNLLANVAGATYVDYDIAPLETYYYIVRCEDSAGGQGGINNGGNEEQNTVMLSATAWAPTSTPGTFVDDGGDENAKLSLGGEWRVTNQQNHTPGGEFSYHNAPDGSNHGPGQCAAATTPPLTLQAGNPQLSYWASFNIEVGWDGLVVEVNDCNPDCDSGSWTISDPTGGYPGDFSDTGTPPINACAYPASQDCFNGPSGNGALTGWSQYGHDLSSWAGQEVQIRWNFSSDGGFEVEGFYVDDIEVTLASVNDPCSTKNGRVRLDRETYSCSDIIGISLGDSDLTGVGAYDEVIITSDSEPGGEALALVESPPNSGSFAGTIDTTDAAADDTDGLLSVADGDTIIVTYVDADDGLGGIDVTKTDTAVVDCVGPVISNVQITDLGGTSVTVLWDTDEDADSLVTVGLASAPPPTVTTHESAFDTVHQVEISGLVECSDYSFFVTSADPAGNEANDDNGGAYYVFSTPLIVDPTYDSTDTPLAINDSTTFSSTISVPVGKTVVDVDVQIDITHTYDGDLDIYLISPIGTRVELTTDNGSTGENFVGTVFDDEASLSIAVGSAPFAGAFRPEGSLATIDGESSAGEWRLEITDDAGGDTGTLNWWKLMLTHPFQSCGPDATYGGLSTVTDSCGAPAVGDGIWDPGENIGFDVTLSNSGTEVLTNVNATIAVLTAGATMTIDGAAYGNIAVQGSVQSQSSYLVKLPAEAACGSTIDFSVEITSDQGSFVDTFSHIVGEIIVGNFTLLSEDFDGSWGPDGDNPPNGWAILDFGNEDPATWNANDWYRYDKGDQWGYVARVYYSPIEDQDEHLITPSFSVPGAATGVDLIYDHYFHAYSTDDSGAVDINSDQLGGWTNLVTYAGSDTANMAHEMISLMAYAGHTNVQIRFRYIGNNDWYWEVDNVEISGTQPTTCNSTPCGTAELIFSDGFESSDTNAWSWTQP